MPPDQTERLRAIRTFPSLVRYLRDELDWPIDTDNFEDLVFDYTAEELGIDKANAAKIQEIKRLRPLTANQPWGIFFVKFEPKRLPVVALRRILSGVVVKQRASANAAERVAWQLDDLLFISSYGEGEDRQISFAHFTHDSPDTQLPTLKVLGWDSLDTPLHLDHVADTLRERLVWPADEGDTDTWREAWRSAFTLRHREVITTSRALAVELAHLARAIRDRIRSALAIETEAGPVRMLMKAFQEALIHDLSTGDFADMYAQTIAYGLLSARITSPANSPEDGAGFQLPVTNPFLRELMETFLHVGRSRARAGGHRQVDFDELGVGDVVELLDAADMEAVVRDFGDRNPLEDPIIHFYELFLGEYDPHIRMVRGVFYTPRPVVSFIVRSVDEALRTHFGLPDGLADTTTWGEMAARHDGLQIPVGTSPQDCFVRILDPATGTGTFLVEVIDLIHQRMTQKWRAESHNRQQIDTLWNDYVSTRLLPRLHGFELLMAPYAIAHLKIGLKLHETGYRFLTSERVQVYLTNSLEPAHDLSQRLPTTLPALAREASAVNSVKEAGGFTVVIGNPPYSTISQNRGEWIRRLVDHYFELADGRMAEKGNRNQLQDDYVKFIRLAQNLVGQCGVVGMITNNSYTRGPWFRGMRYQLTRAFDGIQVVDLHGSQMHALDERGHDQNVFEIVTPVSVSLFQATPSFQGSSGQVNYSEMVGTRASKYATLLAASPSHLSSIEVLPTELNQWRFVPSDTAQHQEEWADFTPLTQVFESWGAGVLTNRNGLAVDTDPQQLIRKITRFADLRIPDSELEADYGFSSNYQWSTARMRRVFAGEGISDCVEPYTFRPFDFRWIYWNSRIVYNMRGTKMEIFRSSDPPLGLLFSRNTRHQAYTNVYVTMHIADRDCLEKANMAPLFTEIGGDAGLLAGLSHRQSNLNSTYTTRLAQGLGLAGSAEPHGDLQQPVRDEDVFFFLYAVLHSPRYRKRYTEYLKIDFPRVPSTSPRGLFRTLAGLGCELVSLHLMRSAHLSSAASKIARPQDAFVEKVAHSGGTVWLNRAQTQGFRPVPKEVWGFHVGGYQVCDKWLKDRKGRALSDGEVVHYQKIVVAISETIRLMGEIDEVIEAHGGWPGAFAGHSSDESV